MPGVPVRAFHGVRRRGAPEGEAEGEIGKSQTYIVVERKVAESTQDRAACALLSLHREVLRRPLDRVDDVVRARLSGRLPVVPMREAVRLVWAGHEGEKWPASGLIKLVIKTLGEPRPRV